MEVIDRKHHEISKNASGKANAFVSFPANGKEVYFSHTAAIEYKIDAGKYLHFAVLSGLLYFYVDNNDEGFKIHADGKPHSKAVKITNRTVVKYLSERFKVIGKNTRFSLFPTTAKQGEASLTEILIYKKKK